MSITTQKWLRVIAINDVYELTNLPRLRTLFETCTGEQASSSLQSLPPPPPPPPPHSTFKKQPDKTIVTLAGDFLSPSLLSSLDRGRGMVDVLNNVPVHYVCFGNHEADLPLVHVKKRVKEYQGTWLNTNMPTFNDDQDQEINGNDCDNTSTVPFDLLDLGDGIHVGLVGLLTDQKGVFSSNTFRGIHIDNVLDSINNAMQSMKMKLLRSPTGEEENNDKTRKPMELIAVVPLTHQSLKDDERLLLSDDFIVNVPLILGGHEHELIIRRYPTDSGSSAHKISNKVLVKTGSDANQPVIVDLIFSLPENNIDITTTVIDAASYQPNENLLNLCVHHEESIALMKTEVLIDCSNDSYGVKRGLHNVLSSKNARYQQTTLGTIFATACREEMLSDCAMINGGPIKGEKE
jgi:5'-nucleotidase